MRRLVFILMIALLPLRGWMGEAMATEMATMHLIATQVINTPANANLDTKKGVSSSFSGMSASAMPADCEMHANATSDSSNASNAADASAAGQTCTNCQSCHAAGLVCTVHIISAITTHTPAPAAHVSLYASAKLALSQKPPIL